jgi:hypothetical protein
MRSDSVRAGVRKVLGILTEDFRLYHDLVGVLKARDVPFTSLSFSRRVPETVGAVLTSPAEAARIRFRNVVSGARAYAMIGGRPMALPEDVQAVFPSVAGHRLAGGTRAGAAQAQTLLRAVPLP